MLLKATQRKGKRELWSALCSRAVMWLPSSAQLDSAAMIPNIPPQAAALLALLSGWLVPPIWQAGGCSEQVALNPSRQSMHGLCAPRWDAVLHWDLTCLPLQLLIGLRVLTVSVIPLLLSAAAGAAQQHGPGRHVRSNLNTQSQCSAWGLN